MQTHARKCLPHVLKLHGCLKCKVAGRKPCDLKADKEHCKSSISRCQHRPVASYAPAVLVNATWPATAKQSPPPHWQLTTDPAQGIRNRNGRSSCSQCCGNAPEVLPSMQVITATSGPDASMQANPAVPPHMSQACLSWFAARQISPATLLRNRVYEQHLQTSKTPQEKECTIVFPYIHNGEIVGEKTRTLGRRFRQKMPPERIWYGLDDIVNQNTIIIVEGEIDKLSMEEAGFKNVVSVPEGANPTVRPVPKPSKDKAFAYVWNCWAATEQAACILLATDDDRPGHALAEELARRLGRQRCLRVSWANTEAAAAGAVSAVPSKDANNVLVHRGPEGVQRCIQQAKPLPC